ncbi:hypothetical protein [Cupriavidus sp. Marseille-Q8015]
MQPPFSTATNTLRAGSGKKADVLKRLISILGQPERMGRINVKIAIEKLEYPIDVEETAFMFLVERVNSYLQQKKMLAC